MDVVSEAGPREPENANSEADASQWDLLSQRLILSMKRIVRTVELNHVLVALR